MAALEVVMENCGVELEWPCSSPPGPNSSAHCGLDAGDVDDVFAPAKESVNNSEGGGTNRRCTTATRKVSSEAGQHRIDSGTRRFRTRPLLPKLPVPPCDSGMSFVSESSPLNFTTSTSGYAGEAPKMSLPSHPFAWNYFLGWVCTSLSNRSREQGVKYTQSNLCQSLTRRREETRF